MPRRADRTFRRLYKMSEQLRIDRDGPDGVVQIVLSRPDRRNALSSSMVADLTDELTRLDADDDVRVITIRGAGPDFCAGADLSELDSDIDSPQNLIWDELSRSLNSLPLLTIAMINGHCIGGAMTLALGCDIRVSVDHASFSYPVLQNGILPGSQDAERMQALIGPGRTSALLLGGQKIDAALASTWGLVDYLVEQQELSQCVTSLAQTAAQSDAEHLAAMKRLCRGR